MQGTRGKEVEGNSLNLNLQPTELKFCKKNQSKRSLQQKEQEFLTKPSQHSQQVNLHHINFHQSRQPQPYSRNSNRSVLSQALISEPTKVRYFGNSVTKMSTTKGITKPVLFCVRCCQMSFNTAVIVTNVSVAFHNPNCHIELLILCSMKPVSKRSWYLGNSLYIHVKDWSKDTFTTHYQLLPTCQFHPKTSTTLATQIGQSMGCQHKIHIKYQINWHHDMYLGIPEGGGEGSMNITLDLSLMLLTSATK